MILINSHFLSERKIILIHFPTLNLKKKLKKFLRDVIKKSLKTEKKLTIETRKAYFKFSRAKGR